MLTLNRWIFASPSPRLALVLLAAACSVFLAWIARLNFVMHDMFHELALVREMFARGEMPLDNPFAFTPTAFPSVHHEWAMGLLLYGFCISTGWGIAGLTVLRWMLIVGILCAAYSTARRRGADDYAIALVALLVIPMAWVGFGTLRAQLVTLLLTAIQIRLMDEGKRISRGWALVLLPLWIVWVNVHAGFLVGAGLLVLDTAERILVDLHRQWRFGRASRIAWIAKRLFHRHWHRFGMLIAGAAALGLTPYGMLYIPFVLHAVGLDRPEIAEWGPLWTTYQPELTLTALLALGAITFAAVRRLDWQRSVGVLSLVVTAYLAIRHIRHGSIFGVVWLCYAPALVTRSGISRIVRDWCSQRPRAISRSATAIIVASCFYFVFVGGWQTVVPVQTKSFGTGNQPTGVVQYIKNAGLRGSVMTPFGAGAYMMWHLYPEVLISMDGRYEVGYPPELLDEHRAFYRGESDWQEMLSRYPCDMVVAPSGSPVTRSLSDSERWNLIYQDDSYVLFSSVGSANPLPAIDRRGKTLPPVFL